jgi:hypothetical protein
MLGSYDVAASRILTGLLQAFLHVARLFGRVRAPFILAPITVRSIERAEATTAPATPCVEHV